MALNVLVIDDSGLMRKMVTRSLRQADVGVGETFEAENGEEGLAALKKHSPDLVLCDWNMPVMDGIEFVKKASEFSTVPVIMLTTEGSSEKVAEARSSGAKGYVTKPFTPEKLGDAIEEVIRSKSA